MANIKLGAIITDIAGSVGGTTFRRTPRGIIAYNKQGTQIKSAFSRYSRKNALGNIFATWGKLGDIDKTFWNSQAAIYPSVNKFGEQVFLSGRQFFTKLNTQLLKVGSFVEASNFDPNVELGFSTGLIINFNTPSIIVTFSEAMPISYGVIEVYPLRAGEKAKPRLKTAPIVIQNGISNTGIEIYPSFIAKFPYARNGNKYGVNVVTLNQSGIQSSVQVFEFIYAM